MDIRKEWLCMETCSLISTDASSSTCSSLQSTSSWVESWEKEEWKNSSPPVKEGPDTVPSSQVSLLTKTNLELHNFASNSGLHPCSSLIGLNRVNDQDHEFHKLQYPSNNQSRSSTPLHGTAKPVVCAKQHSYQQEQGMGTKIVGIGMALPNLARAATFLVQAAKPGFQQQQLPRITPRAA
jgi:hypothetical protein